MAELPPVFIKLGEHQKIAVFEDEFDVDGMSSTNALRWLCRLGQMFANMSAHVLVKDTRTL